MDKQEIFTQVTHIEESLGELHKDLRGLKEQLALMIEENHYLKIENENLRKRLEEKEVPDQAKANLHDEGRQKKNIGEGYDNLARLYQEGFHICNMHYGSIRTDGDCLFCLSFLNQK